MKAKYLYEKGKGRESMEKYWKDRKKEKSDQRRKGFKPPFNKIIPNKIHHDRYAKDESKREDSLGKKGKTTNPMLGMQRRSLVQGFPSQKIQSEDRAQHPRGYKIRIHGKNLCNLRC